jgi:hypothetical protein
LRQADEANKALLATGAGQVGDIAGQIAGTIPLGMGTGAALRGAGIAAGRGFLPNTIKALTAAGENALQGAAYADPTQQGQGAATGAVLGATLGKLGQVGGRALRGIVKMSPEAEAIARTVEEQTDKKPFIPISQGAAPGGISGAAKALYGKVFPYALGVESQLKGQSEEAIQDVLKAREAMRQPLLKDPETGEIIKNVPPAGETPMETAASLAKSHADAYKKNFDNLSFDVPFNFRDNVVNSLRRNTDLGSSQIEKLADSMHGILKDAMPEGESYLTGAQLRASIERADDEAARIAGGKGIRRPEYAEVATQPIRDIIDNARLIARETANRTEGAQSDRAEQFVRNIDNYKLLSQHDEGVANIVKNTEGVPELAGKYRLFSAARAEGPVQTPTAQLMGQGYRVLEKQSPGGVTPAGRHLFHTLAVGPALFGHPGALATALPFIGGANIAATRPVQRALYGQGAFGAQKAMADWIRNNPQAAYSLGMGGRMAAGETRE